MFLSLFDRNHVYLRTCHTESNTKTGIKYPGAAPFASERPPADRATRFLLVATKHNRLNAQIGTLM